MPRGYLIVNKPDADYLFSGIAVTNYANSYEWFEKLFGRAPDVIVQDDIECMWEIREGAWIYIVLDVEKAGKALVTIAVNDLGTTLDELPARGIDGWSTENSPGVYTKAVFSDPDGNTVTFAKLFQAE